MSDPYGRVKGNRLTFKGGDLATRSKPIDKKKKKKKKKHIQNPNPTPNPSPNLHEALDVEVDPSASVVGEDDVDDSIAGAGDMYTIDAAKRMKYDELFPVEAKKFGYEPKSKAKSVEASLDDRVKKKADRYCK